MFKATDSVQIQTWDTQHTSPLSLHLPISDLMKVIRSNQPHKLAQCRNDEKVKIDKNKIGSYPYNVSPWLTNKKMFYHLFFSFLSRKPPALVYLDETHQV